MEETIESLILNNLTNPIAFFDSQGDLILSNKAWENYCNNRTEAVRGVISYQELVALLNLPEMKKDIHSDTIKTKYCDKSFLITRRIVNCNNISGIIVEIQDITGLEKIISIGKYVTDNLTYNITTNILNIHETLNKLLDNSKRDINKNFLNLLIEINKKIWIIKKDIETFKYSHFAFSDIESLRINPIEIKAKNIIENIINYFKPLITDLSAKPEFILNIDNSLCFYSDYNICFKSISEILYKIIIKINNKTKIQINAIKEKKITTFSIICLGLEIKDEDLKKIFDYSGEMIMTMDNKINDNANLKITFYLINRLLDKIDSQLDIVTNKENKQLQYIIKIKDIQ